MEGEDSHYFDHIYLSAGMTRMRSAPCGSYG